MPALSRVENLASRWRERPTLTRLLLLACLAVLPIVALATHLPKRINYTGDEPRYLLQALSFALHGVPVMPEARYEEYRSLHRNEDSPVIYPFRAVQDPVEKMPASRPRHPILASLIFAPIAPTWSLQVIRLLPFCIGLTGLCFLAGTLLKETSGAVSALACFTPAAFCFPALPYQFLALPEIILFALTAIAFWNLRGGARDKICNFAPAIVSSCIAPLIHLRGLALFASTALYLIYLLGRGPGRRSLILVGLIFTTVLLATVAANSVFSALLGTVYSRPIWKLRVLLDMMVHYRHGLLPYAPIWILSFSGLIAAFYRRKPWAWPALLFLVVFLVGSSHEIGEAYPARFWVQTVPVLALCLSGFTEGVMRPLGKLLIYLPLAALSLANSIILVFDPGLHLSARSGAAPYEFLFKLWPSVHFGFWLDVPDSSCVRMAAVCFCILLLVVVALPSVRRSAALELAAGLLLALGLEAHRVKPVSITTATEPNAIVLRAARPEEIARRPIRLRFRAPWKAIGPRRDESTRPMFEVVDGDTRWTMPIMSGSILVHKNDTVTHDFSVTLRWISSDPISVQPDAPGNDVDGLACNSVFARVW